MTELAGDMMRNEPHSQRRSAPARPSGGGVVMAKNRRRRSPLPMVEMVTGVRDSAAAKIFGAGTVLDRRWGKLL
jgi:hypothetical protein